MAGESQELPGGPPDPSVLTTEQMLREVEHAEEISSAKRGEIHRRIDGLKEMLDERYETQTRAVEAARRSDQEAVDKALQTQQTAVDRQQKQADKEFHEHLEQVRHENRLALEAANKLYDQRFASGDLAIQKAEAANEKRFEGVNEFRQSLSDQTQTFIPREVAEATFAELRGKIEGLQKNQDVTSGRGAGMNTLIVVGISMVSLIVAVIIAANTLIGG